ncbi:hypothetical protein PBRA_005852 [Plasmodiophora brassicae]|uniref:Uncharacterized protein n=1 Tax=Plasmodiophora brassicae TaxID=37360 RepID=A0A0G4IQU1_PLABS|nr:hypothetical protein PBRA_005852 [Plasmodiophora brassicae]
MDGPAPSCPSGGIVLDNEGPPGATLELVAGRDKNAPSVSVPRHLAAKHARLLGRMLDNDSTVTSTTVQFDTSTLKQIASFLSMEPVDRFATANWIAKLRETAQADGQWRALLHAANYLEIPYLFEGIIEELVKGGRQKTLKECLDIWLAPENGSMVLPESVVSLLVTHRLRVSSPPFDDFQKAIENNEFDIADRILQWLVPSVRSAVVEDALTTALTSSTLGPSQLVAVLVRHVDNPSIYDKAQRSPLHVAVARKDASIVGELAKACDVNERTPSGDTLLHLAVRTRDATLVETLLASSADPNARNASGTTLLSVAAQKGLAAICKLLIQFGADVNAADTQDDEATATPLHSACRGKNPDIARMLLHAGANVNAVDKFHNTPLHVAVRRNRATLVSILIQDGFLLNIGATDARGRTALIVAAESGSAEIARALLRRGFDPNLVDSTGRNALMHLVQAGVPAQPVSPSIQGLGGYTEMIHQQRQETATSIHQRLIWAMSRAILDLNARDADGTTVLEMAILAGDTWAVDVLLRAGAEPNATSSTDFSLAYVAASQEGCPGRTPMLMSLFAAGARLVPVLEEAICLDNRSAVRELVTTAKADLRLVSSSSGENLVTLAAWSSSADTIRILIDRGAQVESAAVRIADALGDSEMANVLRDALAQSRPT